MRTNRGRAGSRGLGLASAQVSKIEDFLSITGDTRGEVLKTLGGEFRDVAGSGEQLAAVESISSHLDTLGYRSDRVMLDLGIARGLAYYTGPVFEAVLLDAPQFGSVFGGGALRRSGEPFRRPAGSRDGSVAGRRPPARRPGASRQSPAAQDDGAGFCQHDGPRAHVRVPANRLRVAPRRHSHGNQRRAAPKSSASNYSAPTGWRYRTVLIMGADEAARGMVTVRGNGSRPRARSSGIAGHEQWKAARFGQQELPRAARWSKRCSACWSGRPLNSPVGERFAPERRIFSPASRRLAAAVMSALSKSTRVIPVSNFDAKISSMIVAYAFDLDMVNCLVGVLVSAQPAEPDDLFPQVLSARPLRSVS